jgi:nitrogen fixation protein NifU and related proteins
MNYEEDLYKEIILENYRSQKNKGAIEGASFHAEGANPSCGDDLELFLSVNNGVIERITYDGIGCSICCAGANLLCEALTGRSFEAALGIVAQFKGMLLEEQEPDFEDAISDLEAMEGVKKYPVRIKCALLAWNTVEGVLNGAK